MMSKHIAAESVDLIYLDPPFNSGDIRDLIGTVESEKRWNEGVATPMSHSKFFP
jgi:16S rRNA G966 N2-methylase RsmD